MMIGELQNEILIWSSSMLHSMLARSDSILAGLPRKPDSVAVQGD